MFSRFLKSEVHNVSKTNISTSKEDTDCDEQERTLFVANIDERVTEDIFYELFTQAGPVESVRLPKDKQGRRRGFGFVLYEHTVSVEYALNIYSGTCLYNRRLTIKKQDKGTKGNINRNENPGQELTRQSYNMNSLLSNAQMHLANSMMPSTLAANINYNNPYIGMGYGCQGNFMDSMSSGYSFPYMPSPFGVSPMEVSSQKLDKSVDKRNADNDIIDISGPSHFKRPRTQECSPLRSRSSDSSHSRNPFRQNTSHDWTSGASNYGGRNSRHSNQRDRHTDRRSEQRSSSSGYRRNY